MKKDMNEKKYLGYKDQNDLNKMEETLDNLVEERKKVWLIDAVAYIRYSTHMQDNGVSVEYQIQTIENYAAKNGFRIAEWFIDKAVSGKSVEGRKEFNKMLHFLEYPTSPKHIIIFNTSRAFRDAADSAIYREKMRKKGIKLLSATQAIDDETKDGRLMTDIIARLDQYKVEEIGEHVAAAMRLLISEGFYAGGIAPYGYKPEIVIHNGKERAKLVPYEPEAAIVRDLFDAVLAGRNLNQICASFKERGLLTRKGIPFQWDTLRHMLTNIIYKGERLYKMKTGENVYVSNYCTPIIAKDVFDAANRLFEENKTKVSGRKRKSIYPLTGKLVCSGCGLALIGSSSNKYPYYLCSAKYRHKDCSVRRMQQRKLDKVVFDAVCENILSDQAIADITKKVLAQIKKPSVGAESKKDLIKRKLVLEKEIAEIVQMKLKNQITESVMEMMTKDKNAELSSIGRKIEAIELSVDASIDEEYIKKHIKSIFNRDLPFEECSGEMLKELFFKTVDKVEISNTQVVIHLRIPLSKIKFNPDNENSYSDLSVIYQRPPKKRGQ